MNEEADVPGILILYSTTDGQTRRICERMQQVIESHGQTTQLLPLADNQQLDPAQFDAVIIGASVRYGNHKPEVSRYIEHHKAVLATRPCALFSVNLVARDPAKCTPQGNPYFKKLLKRLSWQPPIQEVFAGKLDYPIYTFWDRWMIKLIMKITHGPTDIDTIEYTDWSHVEAFASRMANEVQQ